MSDSEVAEALEQAPANGADIVEAPDKAGGRPAPQRSSSSLHDLPVIVMEGLRTADRTLGENNDRDVVVNELKKVMPSTSDFSQASVVKAIRMPFVSAEGRLEKKRFTQDNPNFKFPTKDEILYAICIVCIHMINSLK